MSSIDRYDWHLNENFPSNLPKENSATHIGFFVHWIIENNLINDEHKNDLTDGLQNVLNRKITGRDFLFNFLKEILRKSSILFSITSKFFSSTK